MGRPRKEAETKLVETLSFRLTEADYSAYEQKVLDSGLSPSEFFRRCVIANRTRIIARPVWSRDAKHLIYHFNKIGNNLNQLAYRINSDHVKGILSQSSYEALLVRLNAISRYLKENLPDADSR